MGRGVKKEGVPGRQETKNIVDISHRPTGLGGDRIQRTKSLCSGIPSFDLMGIRRAWMKHRKGGWFLLESEEYGQEMEVICMYQLLFFFMK